MKPVDYGTILIVAIAAAPFESRSDSPQWSNQNSKAVEFRQKRPERMDDLYGKLEVPNNDDFGSSSPSSSGIVADGSDTNTDNQQVTLFVPNVL